MFDGKRLTRLIVPLVAEEVLGGIIGIVDILMIAHLGEVAVSGLSLIDSLNLMVYSIGAALANGGAIVVSQHLGREDIKGAQTAAKQAAWLMTFFFAGVGLFCFFGNRMILDTLYGAADPAVLLAAETYFSILSLSYPVFAVYRITAALFRAMGNTRISMVSSLMMNIGNVAFNALFIFGMSMGVTGAALGTLLSRVVGAVVVVTLFYRSDGPIRYSNMLRVRLTRKMTGIILRISIPTGIENSVFHIGKILVQRVVTSFGTAAIAANAVALTITEFTHMPGAAIGVAMFTVIGHSVGARKYGEARKDMRKLVGIAYILTFVVCLASFVFARPIIGLYRLEAETAQWAVRILQLQAVVAALVWPTGFVLPRGLQAASDVRYTMLVSVSVMWVFRVGCSVLFARLIPQFGVLVVWFALSLDWVVRAGLFLWRYLGGRWELATRKEQITTEEVEPT